jgi:hypothetical protein
MNQPKTMDHDRLFKELISTFHITAIKLSSRAENLPALYVASRQDRQP